MNDINVPKESREERERATGEDTTRPKDYAHMSVFKFSFERHEY